MPSRPTLYDHETMYLGQRGQSAYAPVSRSRMGCARPNGVFRIRSADGNAVVRAITLVRTIGVMLAPNQQRHVRIVARQVVNRRISLLLQSKRPRRFNNYPSGDRYTHPALSRRNCDGWSGPGILISLPLLVLASIALLTLLVTASSRHRPGYWLR